MLVSVFIVIKVRTSVGIYYAAFGKNIQMVLALGKLFFLF